MNLTEMRNMVRRDLMDEATPQRFSDDQIDRAIQRAVTELSMYTPAEQKTAIVTVSGSYEVDVSSLGARIGIERAEFPIDFTPRRFVKFSLYQDTLTLETQGDGTACYIYWTAEHILDADGTSIPAYLYTLVALGATAYAALSISQYATDKANYGGETVDRDYLYWAKGRLMDFEKGLKKLKSKVKLNWLYATDE